MHHPPLLFRSAVDIHGEHAAREKQQILLQKSDRSFYLLGVRDPVFASGGYVRSPPRPDANKRSTCCLEGGAKDVPELLLRCGYAPEDFCLFFLFGFV